MDRRWLDMVRKIEADASGVLRLLSPNDSPAGRTHPMMTVAGKKITVVGLARSGVAASEFLARQGAHVTATDQKTQEQLGDALDRLRPLGVRLVLGGHPTEIFLDADLIVVSPGVPLTLEPLVRARAAGIPIISELELASRFLTGTLVAVTGSNGKTTVTTLIGELLAAAGLETVVGGNIGRPLTDFIGRTTEASVIVAEVSSFQLEAIETFRPRVAVVTNISPDHLDRHGTLEAYIHAKRRIFLNQDEQDWAVLNADDPVVRAMSEATPARPIFFSRRERLEEGICFCDGRILLRAGDKERELIRREELPLRGWHNVENAMAALGAALAAVALSRDGMDEQRRAMSLADLLPLSDHMPFRQTLQCFTGVEHRLEWVAAIHGVEYFNDSKATNVDSTIKALEAFEGNIVLILGGRDKGSDFTVLRPLVQEKVKHIILLGEASAKIAQALAGTVPMTPVATMADAVRSAAERAEPGDVVLLAPACASFDMFENYEHRGRVFKAEVEKLRRNNRR